MNIYLDWLRKHWSKALLAVLALLCAVAWGQKWYHRKHFSHKQDFIIANQIFERFSKGEPLALEAIEATENILKRHPELHPKYDNMLASTLIAQNKIDKGILYAKKTMARVKENLPSYYQDFAQSSLLVAEKKYEQAYEAAQNLHLQIKDNQECVTLFVMNLLRLIFLSEETGNDIEKKQWFTQLKEQPSYADLATLFQEGELSLADYLEKDEMKQ